MKPTLAGLSAAAFLAATPLLAQETTAPPPQPTPAHAGIATTRGNGAILRALDKVSSNITDLTLAPGEAAEVGRLTVRLGECRFPTDDPNSDAFAQMVITDRNSGATLFDGWMVASSPALSALDDARYDVWVLGCQRS